MEGLARSRDAECIAEFTSAPDMRPGGRRYSHLVSMAGDLREARELLASVGGIMAQAKIRAGQLQVLAEPFDLRLLVERAAAAFSASAAAKGVLMSVAVSTAVGEMVSDRRSVEQIVTNLLSNAVKFSDRGRIALSAERVADLHPPNCAAPQRMVRIRVEDTGIGIKSKDLPSLFQPQRAEDAASGLMISRCLARLLGGEMSADSEWSKGSKFSVFLPLCLPQ